MQNIESIRKRLSKIESTVSTVASLLYLLGFGIECYNLILHISDIRFHVFSIIDLLVGTVILGAITMFYIERKYYQFLTFSDYYRIGFKPTITLIPYGILLIVIACTYGIDSLITNILTLSYCLILTSVVLIGIGGVKIKEERLENY